MFYYNVILAVSASAAALALSLYHTVKKNRGAAGLVLAAAGAAASSLLALMTIGLLDASIIPGDIARRTHLTLLILIAALLLCFFILHPGGGPMRHWNVPAALLPAAAFSVVILFTGHVVAARSGAAAAHGPLYPAYLAAVSLYMCASPAILLIRALQHRNRALRADLLLLCGAFAPLATALMALSLYLPHYLGIDLYVTVGTSVPLCLILIVLSYASGDTRTIDMKKFYGIAVYWIILLSFLIIPCILVLSYNREPYLKDPIPPQGVAILLFSYLFLFFKYLRPRIVGLFSFGYRRLAARVDELFAPQFLAGGRKEEDWENFLSILVDGLTEKFGFQSAHLYLSGGTDEKFIIACGTGSRGVDSEVKASAVVAVHLGRTRSILYRPALALENVPAESRDQILTFMEKNRCEALLPFLNPEGGLIGFLALGPLLRNHPYSRSLLSVLDLFRIQLQQHLANTLMLEQARATQVIEHDQMVITSIKKKILPGAMNQAKGYRAGSLYIDNSRHGGDYLDSAAPGGDRLVLFMADSSYAGIESAIVSMELYTVFHTPVKIFDSPNRVLDTMNMVLSTSRFTEKYAPAYCAILSPGGVVAYSNAAFRPMVVYNPDTNSFATCDASGVALGVDRSSTYESKTIRLVPGSIGILCSDGLASAVNQNGEIYGLDRALEIIRRGRGTSPSELTRSLYEDLTAFIGARGQIRDISAIIFRYQ